MNDLPFKNFRWDLFPLVPEAKLLFLRQVRFVALNVVDPKPKMLVDGKPAKEFPERTLVRSPGLRLVLAEVSQKSRVIDKQSLGRYSDSRKLRSSHSPGADRYIEDE